jgi:hypothetical protein
VRQFSDVPPVSEKFGRTAATSSMKPLIAILLLEGQRHTGETHIDARLLDVLRQDEVVGRAPGHAAQHGPRAIPKQLCGKFSNGGERSRGRASLDEAPPLHVVVQLGFAPAGLEQLRPRSRPLFALCTPLRVESGHRLGIGALVEAQADAVERAMADEDLPVVGSREVGVAPGDAGDDVQCRIGGLEVGLDADAVLDEEDGGQVTMAVGHEAGCE